jgi:hypothetical protein
VVAVGVEWAERSEPADRGGLPAADAVVGGRDALVVLTDPARRIAEHRRYETIVHRALGPARGADPPVTAWAEAVPELRAAWEKIKVKYDDAERTGPPPQPANGSWRGEHGQRLDAKPNADVDRGYARIREVGERVIIPVLRAVEAEDPTRTLAGFEHCFKHADRLKEKIADQIRSTPGTTPAQALSAIPDALRFTYQYDEMAYSASVRKDVDRLEAQGFTQVEQRNTWTSDQYKGINSRWREPASGVVFEVQFHTRASLEAKELTHEAYERMRGITGQTPETDREIEELRDFQRHVNAKIPIPPGVTEYEDYRPERRNGR